MATKCERCGGSGVVRRSLEGDPACILCSHVQGHKVRGPQGEELSFTARAAYSRLDKVLDGGLLKR